MFKVKAPFVGISVDTTGIWYVLARYGESFQAILRGLEGVGVVPLAIAGPTQRIKLTNDKS